MESSFKDQLEIYRTLSGVAKLIVDVLAYACCPIKRDLIERLFPSINSPGSKLHETVQRLNRADILRYWAFNDIDYYTLAYAPELSLFLLLEQAKGERNIELEFMNRTFWHKEIYPEGKLTREFILARYFNVTLPYDPHKRGDDSIARIVRSTQAKLVEVVLETRVTAENRKGFSEKFLIRHFRESVYRHVEFAYPDPLIPCWYDKFTKVHTDSASYLNTLRDILAIPEFLMTGRIDEIPGKVSPDTREGKALLGMYHLYHGEYAVAHDYFIKARARETETDDYAVTECSLFRLGYAITLLHIPEKTPSIASKGDDNVFNTLITAVISNKDQEEIARLLSGRDTLAPLVQYLLHALKICLGLDAINSMTFFEREATTMGWHLPFFVYHFIAPMTRSVACLKEQVEKNRPDKQVRFQEPWAFSLNYLMTSVLPEDVLKEGLVNVKISKESNTRIVYFIETWGREQWMIVPMIQKSRNDGTWTSGAKIAQARLKEDSVPGMNSWDHKLAEAGISKEEKIALLAGHPHVYLIGKNKVTRIDITEIKPAITIHRDDTGYSVTTNFHEFSYQTKVEWEKRFTGAKVYQTTPRQYSILSVLNKLGHLPMEARDSLLVFQKKLQDSITIHSDLVDDENVEKVVEADSQVIIQFTPLLDVFRARLVVRPFPEAPLYFEAGTGPSAVSCLIKGEKHLARRDMEKEKQNLLIAMEYAKTHADYCEEGGTYLYTRQDKYFQLLEAVGPLRKTVKMETLKHGEGW